MKYYICMGVYLLSIMTLSAKEGAGKYDIVFQGTMEKKFSRIYNFTPILFHIKKIEVGEYKENHITIFSDKTSEKFFRKKKIYKISLKKKDKYYLLKNWELVRREEKILKEYEYGIAGAISFLLFILTCVIIYKVRNPWKTQ